MDGSTNARTAWPAGDVTRVPYWAYQDQDVYQREQERIYQGPVWNYLCAEVEIPEPGDYITNFVGDMPVIVNRGPDGGVYAFENRCAHRGALLAFKNKGRAKNFVCAYHAWRHDFQGNLLNAAFAQGVNGQGGMPADFDVRQHGPRKLRTAILGGLVFGTLSDATPPILDYLGPGVAGRIVRVLHKPLRVLGRYTQVLPHNWKLYFENVKDSYHSSILHTFFSTFKVSRLSQGGGLIVSDSGGNHASYSETHSGGNDSEFEKEQLRSNQANFRLQDKGLLEIADEYHDNCHVQAATMFPGFVLQTVHNNIAVRHLLPKGPHEAHLQWTMLGFADDDEKMHALRMKQSNLVGPAGYVSLEDGAIGGFVQRGVAAASNEAAVVLMGGRETVSSDTRTSEAAIRGFWKAWRNHTEL